MISSATNISLNLMYAMSENTRGEMRGWLERVMEENATSKVTFPGRFSRWPGVDIEHEMESRSV